MEQYTDKTLFGIHIGEHGFDATKVMDELRECVEKGLNFVTIRPIRGPQGNKPVPDHYYYEWAEYMTKHEIYFVFLYALQEHPEGQDSHLTPEINENLKRIAGKYYLGDMLGETGSTYACKLRGYFGDENDPDLAPQDAKDMKEAADNYSAVLKDLVKRERATGVPNVVSVEATMLNNYNVEAGADIPFAEIPCADPETVIPALRGTARAYDSKLWGTYVAHEWYAGMRHFDRLKDARFELVHKYAYLQGSQVFCLESGLSNIHSYGTALPHDNPISIKNRQVFYRLGRYFIDDDRPAGGPITRVAFVQGNHDGYGGGWGGSSLWSQFEGEQWGHSDAEHSWKIINDVNKKRDWWEPDSYATESHDVSGALNGGVYDIIPATASAKAMSKYDCLIFVGWNTMTEEIAENLLTYVKGGGKLLLSAAHLNTEPDRAKKPVYLNNETVRELLGCRLTGKTRRSNFGMRFISDSEIPNMHYPFAHMTAADPIHSHGYVDYAETELAGGNVCSILSKSFRIFENELNETPTLIENKCGEGHVIFLTSEAFPGNGSAYPMYRVVVRELLRAETENEPQLILAPDSVCFAIYDGGIAYLLNTDIDLPAAVILLPDNDASETVVIKPMELIKVKLSDTGIEILDRI